MIGRSWYLSSPTSFNILRQLSHHFSHTAPTNLVTILPAHFHHCLLADTLSVIPHVNLRGSGWFYQRVQHCALRLQQYSNSLFTIHSSIHRLVDTGIDLCHDVIVTASSFCTLTFSPFHVHPAEIILHSLVVLVPAQPNLARPGGNFHTLLPFHVNYEIWAAFRSGIEGQRILDACGA